ncbi:MAG: DNA polymerase III subunit gamma/tau [Lentisphaeria bacterium]|nr:DNA polymerase III subunit gamma/tau [Lentisphaeria bacterium]
MSEYQVIARKWRPGRFSDVVGQQHVVRTLLNAIDSKRTAHAYLFVGPRGVGKTTLARIFAKAMNCLDDRNGEPCCECESCRAIIEERSLDVIEVDAASRNSTGDMRELAEDVLTRPTSGRYKIYIIDEVHMLSKAAWNVLLKTVEEPPAHVKFIFATTEVHQVLPTIISRCQRFDLLPIPTKLIAERLALIARTENVNLDDNAINAIARAAEGGMRDAQSLLDQMIAYFSMNGEVITEQQVLSLFGLTDSNDLELLINSMVRNAPQDVVAIINALSKRGKNLETLFDDLLSALRAVHLASIMNDVSDMLDESAETIERYRNIAASTDAETLQIMLETISPVGRVLHDALNKQVYLETILLKAMREAHAVRVSDILNLLNQLRGAGELQFLDKLPPAARENVQPQPQTAKVDITSLMTPQEEPRHTAAAAPEVKPEPVPVQVPAPVKEEKIEETPVHIETAAEEIIEEAPTQQETVAEEKVEETPVHSETAAEEKVIEAPPAPETPVVETPVAEEVRTFDEPAAEEVLSTIKLPSKPQTAPAKETVYIPQEEETTLVIDDDGDIPPLEETAFKLDNSQLIEKIAKENSVKALAPEAATPRRSVINDSVDIKRQISADPEVVEILELFRGDVVDLHK